MNKQTRQFTIREIITREPIGNQEDLVQALAKAGIEVTQATLSRDLAEMGVARVATADGPRYVPSQESEDQRLRALLSYEVTGIQHNESMIVVKTLPGRAHGVAELIDLMRDSEIMATIAGDNTIFIAPTTVTAIPKLLTRLRTFITTSDET